MKKEQLIRCAGSYETPRVKTVKLSPRSHYLQEFSPYGDYGFAGHDGVYDPYNEGNDL